MTRNNYDDPRDQREAPRNSVPHIPEGDFAAECIDYALGVAGTGTEQIGVAFRVTEGPSAGKAITWYGYFTDGAIETTIKALKVLGWKTGDLNDLDVIIGGKCHIVVEHETDERGDTRARVRWVNGTGGVAMKNLMDDAAKARLNSRIRGIAARLGGRDDGGGREEPWGRDRGRDDRRQATGYGRDDIPPPDDRDAPPPRRGRDSRW